MVSLCTWADYQPNSRAVLREQRELIEESDFKRFQMDFAEKNENFIAVRPITETNSNL